MRDFNIGNVARVLLELVPNAIMYAKSKSMQDDSPTVYNDESINNNLKKIIETDS